MKKTVWWVVALVVLVIVVVAVSGTSKKPAETGPIKIGYIGPMTGDAATFGEPIANSIKLAEKTINAAGGANGRQLQVMYEDGKCDSQSAVSAAQKLINIDQVKFLVIICSNEVLPVAPIATAAKVLILSPSATSPKITGVSPYVMRNAPSDALRGVAIADKAAASFQRPAIISQQTDYSQGLHDQYVGELVKKGVPVVADEKYSANVTDFRSMLLKIKAAKADAIFLDAQTPEDLIRLAQQARAVGITAQFFASEFNDPTVIAAKADEGMIIGVAPDLSSEGKGGDLLKAYRAEFNKDATYPYYVGAAVDDMNLIARGVAQNGYDATAVRDYLKGLKSYDGIIGIYSFDQNGDVVGLGFVFQKVVNGSAVYVK